MNVRRSLVTLVVAAVVAALVFSLGRGLGGLDVREPSGEPTFRRERITERPPLIEPTPDPAARLVFWLRMLVTGDEQDVRWAARQIMKGGDPARAAVLAAAQRSVRGNPALVQQALDILLTDPRPDLFPLARDVLESRDPHGVTRAILLLGRLGAVAEPVATRLGALAADREYPIPQYAMTALAQIGTPAARDAAMDAVTLMDARQRGYGYVALAEIGGPEVVDFLQKAFAAETAPESRVQAAEGLLRAGDDSPRPWLREELERTPPGTPHHEAVLAVLARAADASVLRELSGRASDTLDSAERRAAALEHLRPFPLPDVEPLLRRLSRQGVPVEVRVEAFHHLVDGGASGAWRDVLSMLAAPGPTLADDRRVGALVTGRVRRPEAGPPIITALATLPGFEGEARSLHLRALCLSGHLPGAEAVVRAVAGDRSKYGVGGIGFDVMGVLSELTPEFGDAFGEAVIRGLEGEFGPAESAGLQFLLLYAPVFCGAEAAPAVGRFVSHDERPIREAAVAALAYVGGPDQLPFLVRAWNEPQDELLREQLRDTFIKLQHRAED